MKKCIFILVCAFLSISLHAQKQVGKLSIVSTRNIETGKQYNELYRYVTGSGESLEKAVENTISKVNGGEYLLNATVSLQNSDFVVSGDVWGIYNPNINTTITYIGDTIVYKNWGKTIKAVILDMNEYIFKVKLLADYGAFAKEGAIKDIRKTDCIKIR